MTQADVMKAAVIEAEETLAENLTWLADQLDQQIRQKDPETIRKLAQLNAAWTTLCMAKVGM